MENAPGGGGAHHLQRGPRGLHHQRPLHRPLRAGGREVPGPGPQPVLHQREAVGLRHPGRADHQFVGVFPGMREQTLRKGGMAVGCLALSVAASLWAARCAAPTKYGRPWGPTTPAARGRLQGPPLRLKRAAFITGTVPLIRLAFGQPPSPKGEGFAGGASPSPTEVKNALPFQVGEALGPPARFALGALARQRQARRGNCTSPQFWDSQGPVARREFRTSLRFCAPEMRYHKTGERPS